MIRRLVITYLVITALGLALLAIPLGLTFAHREKDRLLFDVERDADTMSVLVENPVATGKPFTSSDITRYARDFGGHVVVVNAKGIALLDTEHPDHPGDYSQNRPEITDALNGKHVNGTRHSNTAGTTLVFAAVPVTANGRVDGALRITYPTATLEARVRKVWSQLALLCLGVLVTVAIVGFVFARGVTRPVRRLEDAADRFASGDLEARVEENLDAPPELRRLASTFNRMAARLARLIDAQQRFVADASHQLRTPLTALRLRLENLEAHVDTADRPAIDAATAEVTRMSRLVDGLLLLARDDAESAASVPVDVAAIVHARADIWADVVHERSVVLEIDAPAAAWALAVPGAVEQLVDNFVDNALAVSPSHATITVRVDASTDRVALHVLDEGPGLDPQSRARAFDRFWRAPDAAPGGSGLGLAIVRRLVDASGGSARLDARTPHGIDAVVELPAAGPPPATPPSDRAEVTGLTWR